MSLQSFRFDKGLFGFRHRLWGRVLAGLMALTLAVVLPSCSLSMFETQAADVPRIVEGLLSDPKTFNYALNNESPNIFGLTYEGLVTDNPLTGEIEPALAESWDISDDGMNIVFTLREGLKWSDGEPLTVEDVVFTYNDIFLNEEIPTDTRDILRVGEEGKLPQVRKLDDRRVEFQIPEPFAPFLRITGLAILPQHVLKPLVEEKDSQGQPKFLSAWDTSTDPDKLVFNGPYMLERYVPGERLIFERNPYYWRTGPNGEQQPYIEQIVWQIVESQNSEFAQFRSGGLDDMSVTPDNFSLMKQTEEQGNYTVYNGGPAPGTLFMTFNLNQGSRNGQPLVDPMKARWFNTLEFRQAVAHTIDRETMLNNIYRGLGVLQNSPISYQSPYFASAEDGLPVYEYDLEKAKELLLSAGFQYASDGRLLDWNDNPVRFTLLTNAGNAIREAVGAQVKQDLGKIGIRVDFQPIDFGSLVSKLSDSLEWESIVLGFTGGVEPNNGANLWLADGGLHFFNQKPPPGAAPLEGREVYDWEAEISNLYIEAAQELDEDERRELYVETQRLTQEYLPFIYLINQYSMVAVRDKIEGVEYSALGGALWNIHELRIAEE